MPIYEKLKEISKERHSSIFWEYCDEVEIQIRVIYLFITLAQKQDKGQLIAKLALSKFNEKPDDDVKRYQDMDEIKSEVLTEGPATRAFFKIGEDLYKNMFVRNVENFETFLSDILAKLYHQKPDMLKSKETITIDEVLQFENREELIKYIAETRIMKLQMQGLRAVNKYVNERHGLKWFSDSDVELLNKVTATRNLIVHNKSRINFHYLSLYPNSNFSVGEKIQVRKVADSEICNVLSIASKVDATTVEKFGFETIRFEDYKKSKIKE